MERIGRRLPRKRWPLALAGGLTALAVFFAVLTHGNYDPAIALDLIAAVGLIWTTFLTWYTLHSADLNRTEDLIRKRAAVATAAAGDAITLMGILRDMLEDFAKRHQYYRRLAVPSVTTILSQAELFNGKTIREVNTLNGRLIVLRNDLPLFDRNEKKMSSADKDEMLLIIRALRDQAHLVYDLMLEAGGEAPEIANVSAGYVPPKLSSDPLDPIYAARAMRNAAPGTATSSHPVLPGTTNTEPVPPSGNVAPSIPAPTNMNQPATRTSVDYLLAAEYACMNERRRLCVVGVLNHLQLAQLPTVQGAVYVGLQLTAVMGDHPYSTRMQVAMIDPGKNVLGEAYTDTIDVRAAPSASVRSGKSLHVVRLANIPFSVEGDHGIQLLLDGTEAYFCPILVQAPQRKV